MTPRHHDRAFRAIALTGFALAVLAMPAAAQEALTVPTNLPAVRAAAPAPQNFDPVSATDGQLVQYGFPPRPDKTQNSQAYSDWKKLVTTPFTRIVPTLEETSIYHGPAQLLQAKAPATPNVSAATTTTTSSNWSGYVIYDNTKPFKLEEVEAQFTVPVAQQAFGTCSGSYFYSSAWVGIDGFNINNTSPDVFQAGVEMDATCSTPYYATWIEWYPLAENRVNGFATNPGDLMRVIIQSTSPTTGTFYLYNWTANQTTTLYLTAPSPTTLQGNSVEWIVERPSVNSSLATLTNYVGMPFTFSEAWNYSAKTKKYYYPSKAPTGKIYYVTMLDNSNGAISYPELFGTWDLWFYDEGSAYGSGIGASSVK